MITAQQAQQYLDQALGVGVPSFLIDLAIAKVAAAEPAMTAAGYSAADQALIQCYSVAIIVGTGARRIQSQGAPSGASRSFKTEDKALTEIRRALSHLDKAGTVAGIVGPDPKSGTLFMVV